MRVAGLGLAAAAMLSVWAVAAPAEARDGEGDLEGRRPRVKDDDERGSDRDDWVPYAMRDEIHLDAWWWSADRVGSTFAFVFGGQALVSENVAAGFWLPWTFNVRSAGDPIAAFGNPTLDVHYVDSVDLATFHVGGGISAPLASIQDDSGAYRIAAVQGTATLAAYDSHFFLPTALPLRIAYGGVELRLVEGVSLLLGVDPILFIPIEGGDVEFVLQEHAEILALSEPGLGGGLRLQGVHPLTSGGDLAQMSMEPFLAYDDEEDFFMRLGLLMALDTPLGFAFDTQRVLSAHLQIGGYTGGDDSDF
jgi:hypothetical protein